MANTQGDERSKRSPDYYINLMTQLSAEDERRSRVTPEEKVAENFSSLHDQLDKNPSISLLLQPTPPGHMARARCYASCCLEKQEDYDLIIRDDYRLVTSGGAITEYFHVKCLEKMPGLAKLAPTRFKLDVSDYPWFGHCPWPWGFMLRVWFEHSGCIDLEKIIGYRKACKKYNEEYGNFSTQYLDWQFKCKEQPQHGESSRCLPEPEPPEEPILGDYTVGEDKACLLSAVVDYE